MTDQEIIQGLINHDNHVTKQFFFVKCRPLLTGIMRLVFPYQVDYDEMVSELYEFLMVHDGEKLRKFQYRSTIFQWMKVVATRFFIRRRNSMIENMSKEPLYYSTDYNGAVNTDDTVSDRIDVAYLLRLMKNERYAETIRCLILDDKAPEIYAAEMGVTVANLYNIKKRAISALTALALKHYGYGQ